MPILDHVFFAGREETRGIDRYAARVGLVRLNGSFTVASSHKLVAVISVDIRDHDVVIFDFSGATHLDDSAAMVIERLIDVAGKAETEIIVTGLAGSVNDTLDTLNILQHVPEDRIVETLDEARDIAARLLGERTD